MKFNPSDKEESLIADIDFLLFGTSAVFNTDYSLADRTRNINIALDETVSDLFRADPNFMWDDTTNPDFPIAWIDLESGKNNYVLPDSSLVVHRMRVKDTNGQWRTLTPALRRELTDDELAATGLPTRYYKIDNGLFPIPIPNYGATNGVELEFQRGANHFDSDDTDKSPGFASIFHQILSVGAALRYAISNGLTEKAQWLRAERQEIQDKIISHYERRSKDEKPKLRLKRNRRGYGL